MLRKLLPFGLAIVFLAGFSLYAAMPRSDSHREALVEQLLEEGILLEDGALFIAEYRYPMGTVEAAFTSWDYYGTLEECAAQAIRVSARRMAVQLPEGYEEEITIDTFRRSA